MLILAVILAYLMVYLTIEYMGPAIIPIRPGRVFGFPAMRADDLIVQEYDKSGNLWATRGPLVYRMIQGDNRFTQVARVPTGRSLYWLNHFRVVRILLGKSECLEMVLTGESGICAMSAGKMWYSPAGGKTFTETLALPHYGPGIGRGMMHYGILGAEGNRIWFGEYFYNEEKTAVKIFQSNDHGQTWQVAREFTPGEIRHIHAIQRDPYTGKIWICTGDKDSESMIGWTGDNFNTLTAIGQGSQIWRSCHLVFAPEHVYWGTDTGTDEVSGVYCWTRATGEVTRICAVAGAIFYGTRLAGGMIVMSTDREGFPNEKDDKTKIIIVSNGGSQMVIDGGAWKQKVPALRNGYAMLRLPRNQGGSLLAMTVLNQDLPEGELVLIEEEELQKKFPDYGMDHFDPSI